jgi:hypothetical protein
MTEMVVTRRNPGSELVVFGPFEKQWWTWFRIYVVYNPYWRP